MASRSSPDFILSKIGGKWKIPILWYLSEVSELRYGKLKNKLDPISHAILSRQLKELARDDLVHRKLYQEVPPKVEYSLTARGRATIPALNALCELESVLDIEK